MRGSRPLEKEEIRMVRTSFAGANARRNEGLFVVGVNTGFRISELLSLRLTDVLEESGEVRDRVTVARRHTKGKHASRTVLLNAAAKRAIGQLVADMKRDGYLTRESFMFHSCRGNRAIGRVQAYKILRAAFLSCGLRGRLGTHALRKSFANAVYRSFLARVAAGEPIDAFRATSKALGHADIKSTDAYLSFLTEDVDAAVRGIAEISEAQT